MRFIDIRSDLSLNIDNIISIEDTDSGSKITTRNSVLNSGLPRKVLISLIQSGENIEHEKEGPVEDSTDHKQVTQFFGG